MSDIYMAEALMESVNKLAEIENGTLTEGAATEVRKEAEAKLKVVKSEKLMKDYMKGKLSKDEATRIWKQQNKAIDDIIKDVNKIPPETDVEKVIAIAKAMSRDVLTVNGIMIGTSQTFSAIYSFLSSFAISKAMVKSVFENGGQMTNKSIIALILKVGKSEVVASGKIVLKVTLPFILLYSALMIFVDAIILIPNTKKCNFNKNVVMNKLKAYKTTINSVYESSYKNKSK